ncbi:MAG: hypothetical protein HZA81_00660 [Candidatus Taylorbacteria bacterium]|nr:hypothetical protein [Candidatus Taylorbacteria bacterium]
MQTCLAPIETITIGKFVLSAPKNRLELVSSLFARYHKALNIELVSGTREEMVNLSWPSYLKLQKEEPRLVALLEALGILSAEAAGNFEIVLTPPGGSKRTLDVFLVDGRKGYFTTFLYATLYDVHTTGGCSEFFQHPAGATAS